MKLFSLCLALLLLFPWNSKSQTTPEIKVKLFKAIIHTTYDTKVKGFLYAVTDSSVFIVKDESSLATVESYPWLIEEIPSNLINTVKVRRNGSVLIGAAIGAFAAIPITSVVKKSIDKKKHDTFQDISNSINTVGLTFIIFPTLGVLFGAHPKKTYKINHSVYNYRTMWFPMSKYSYKFQKDIAIQMKK